MPVVHGPRDLEVNVECSEMSLSAQRVHLAKDISSTFRNSFTFEVVCAEETHPRPLKEAAHLSQEVFYVAKTRSAVSAAGKIASLHLAS